MVSEMTSGLGALLTLKGLLNLLFILAAVGIGALVSRRLFAGFLRFGGKRIVSCPENKQTVAVELDRAHAALTGVGGKAELRLTECTRWPERAGCGQMCLSQIEASPEGCLLKNILGSWYQGKQCVFCGQDLSNIDWTEHRPALRSPEGKTLVWSEIQPEQVYGVLETHQPLCWNCHVAEQFRAEHPDLVVDRGLTASRDA